MGVIDIDGQCNLTTWFFGGGVDAEQDPEPVREADFSTDEDGATGDDAPITTGDDAPITTGDDAPNTSVEDHGRAFWEVPTKVFQVS